MTESSLKWSVKIEYETGKHLSECETYNTLHASHVLAP